MVVVAKPSSQKVSLSEALVLAIHLHRSAELGDAETLYRRILAADPEHPDATHFLGVLLHQRDRSDAALELMERSIALDPDHADRYNNFGNALVERGRLGEATNAYQRSIALIPGHADAWNNLGAVLRAQGRIEEAGAAYLKAIELDPKNVNAHNNYGNLLSSQGRASEAVAYYCQAITLMPNHGPSKRMLGMAYYTLGQIDAAAEVYRNWLKDEPSNPIAEHMLAACSNDRVPARASDAYVESTFDGFAGSFDQKLANLSYRAPALVAEALARVASNPQKRMDGLDAGCGTGLCGPLIAPFVRRLTGVDLSSKMLAIARVGRGYDELVQGELTAFLRRSRTRYDLIVSADTLVYFGALEEVFAAAQGALRPGGLLIFTLEAIEEGTTEAGHRIEPHGRYGHEQSYARRSLVAAGFAVVSIDPAVLRMESGEPVNGWVVAARSPIA